jgi:hypothetical protein
MIGRTALKRLFFCVILARRASA